MKLKPRCVAQSSPIRLIVAVLCFLAHTSEARSQTSAISVEPEPAIRIGMVDGPAHFMFQFLTEAQFLPGGNLLAADRISGDLRVFTPEGQFVRSFGGQGQGPSEFRHIGGVEVRGDTIVVHDPILGKLVYYTIAGEFISSEPVRQFGATLIGISTEGTAYWSWMVAQVEGPARGLSADSITIAVSTLGESNFTRVAGTIVTWRYQRIPYPFSPVTRPMLFRDSLVIADPVRGRMAVIDRSGVVGRRFNAPLPPVNTRAAWSILEDQIRTREDLRSRRDWDIPRVDQLPRMSAMLVDPSDRIWIKQYDPSEDAHWLGGWAGGEGGKWLVIDAAGELVGSVVLPERTTPLHIGRVQILARYRDEWDVQYLVVHNVRGR